jgi:hypothetical protein
MNFLTDFILAFPSFVLVFISIATFVYVVSKSKDIKKYSIWCILVYLMLGIFIALNSPLVKPKTNVEPFKPSEVVTHRLDEETASKPFTSRLSKPKESKLSESLTFKREVQEINK